MGCRSCNLLQDQGWIIEKCIMQNTNFKCAICNSKNFYYHKPGYLKYTFSYECDSCHDYIIYFHNDDVVLKEEYYHDDCCLIKNYDKDITVLLDGNDSIICELNYIVDASIDFKKMFDKLKKYRIFS